MYPFAGPFSACLASNVTLLVPFVPVNTTTSSSVAVAVIVVLELPVILPVILPSVRI